MPSVYLYLCLKCHQPVSVEAEKPPTQCEKCSAPLREQDVFPVVIEAKPPPEPAPVPEAPTKPETPPKDEAVKAPAKEGEKKKEEASYHRKRRKLKRFFKKLCGEELWDIVASPETHKFLLRSRARKFLEKAGASDDECLKVMAAIDTTVEEAHRKARRHL